MQKLNQALEKVSQGQINSVQHSRTDAKNFQDQYKLPNKKIAELFDVFTRAFGHRWMATANDAKAREVWLIALNSAGVSEAMLNVGIKKSIKLTWPPSIGELISLCSNDPKEHGLPSEADAFDEAVMYAGRYENFNACNWSHAVVFHAAKNIGAYKLSTKDEKTLKKLWHHYYLIAVRLFINGGNVDQPVPIPIEHLRTVNKEKSKMHMDKLFSILGIKSVSNPLKKLVKLTTNPTHNHLTKSIATPNPLVSIGWDGGTCPKITNRKRNAAPFEGHTYQGFPLGWGHGCRTVRVPPHQSSAWDLGSPYLVQPLKNGKVFIPRAERLKGQNEVVAA